MISSMLAPASRFSKTVATGIRVPRKTQAPLTFPGMLSTAGHCDQSRLAICQPSTILGHVWRLRITQSDGFPSEIAHAPVDQEFAAYRECRFVGGEEDNGACDLT